MKLFITFLLMALFTFLTGIYFPWWVFVIPVFAISLFLIQAPWKSFLVGFAAVFVLWAAIALYLDRSNAGILSAKVAAILPFGGSTAAIILTTAFIGGILGGFASLTGTYFRKAFL